MLDSIQAYTATAVSVDSPITACTISNRDIRKPGNFDLEARCVPVYVATRRPATYQRPIQLGGRSIMVDRTALSDEKTQKNGLIQVLNGYAQQVKSCL